MIPNSAAPAISTTPRSKPRCELPAPMDCSIPAATNRSKWEANNGTSRSRFAMGLWHDDDFGRIEFASDYKTNGLHDANHTFGLGVPLIVVRNPAGMTILRNLTMLRASLSR